MIFSHIEGYSIWVVHRKGYSLVCSIENITLRVVHGVTHRQDDYGGSWCAL